MQSVVRYSSCCRTFSLIGCQSFCESHESNQPIWNWNLVVSRLRVEGQVRLQLLSAVELLTFCRTGSNDDNERPHKGRGHGCNKRVSSFRCTCSPFKKRQIPTKESPAWATKCCTEPRSGSSHPHRRQFKRQWNTRLEHIPLFPVNPCEHAAPPSPPLPQEVKALWLMESLMLCYLLQTLDPKMVAKEWRRDVSSKAGWRNKGWDKKKNLKYWHDSNNSHFCRSYKSANTSYSL